MKTLPPETQAAVDAAAKSLVDRALADAIAHTGDPRAKLTGLSAALHREIHALPAPRRAEVVAAKGKLPVAATPAAARRPAAGLTRPVAALRPAITRPALGRTPQPQGAQADLGLEALTLRCDRDSLELGEDEIQLAAFFVDADLGEVLSSAPTSLGAFKRGDSKDLDIPPLVFNFNAPIAFPHTFLAVLCLAEADNGGFASFVADVLEALVAELEPPPPTSTATKILIGGIAIATVVGGAAVGAAIGGAGPLSVGLIIASSIIAALTYLTALVAAWLGDELFPTQTVTLVVPDAASGLAQGNQEAFSVRFQRSVADYTLDGRFFLQV